MDSTSTGIFLFCVICVTKCSGIHDNNWEAPWIKGNPKQAITPVTGMYLLRLAAFNIMLVTGNENPFHCVFTAVKNASLSTAAFYDWDWLMYLGNESIQVTTLQCCVMCDHCYSHRQLIQRFTAPLKIGHPTPTVTKNLLLLLANCCQGEESSV